MLTGFDDSQGPVLRAEGALGGEPGLQAGLDRPAVDRPAEPRPGRGRDRGPGRLRGGPGTSSRLHPLQRPKLRALLDYARPGDTVHLSEMCRLVRGTGHILDVLDVLHHDQVALRIHDGAFSAMVLTARHPRTGELLSTVKSMVQTSPPTYEGLRAAGAKGSKGGRRPAVAVEKTGDVRTAYLGADRLPPSPATTASAAAPSAPPSPTSCLTATPPRRAPRPRSRRSPSTCRASRRLPPRRRSGARRVGRARPKHAIRHRV
ncbi:recombinase family protein [Streptomyces sp. NBC_00257]|uniref:recombinase family protein n=1 Tax=unclassified Streptomyces TaxID=2593676 RepID=UPI002251EAFD|nr:MULTISPECIES: recombinase family protein [unclassified Streptomyces]MCX4870957.1 recombinase family protein [Streptomyces sp. NBC_00906]MCX4901696.1 recombinase family protein [Streptomyces sp. NBC_00892]MCX5426938.1 recombinase family protein [Streptomyces sp. NBC_00062]